MTVSGRQAEKRSTTLQLVPRGVCRGIWKNSTLDSELVTFQFSHTLCGFWQTSSPAGKPTEARKAERKLAPRFAPHFSLYFLCTEKIRKKSKRCDVSSGSPSKGAWLGEATFDRKPQSAN